MIGMGTPSSSLAHSGRHPVITHPFAPQWPALCRSLSEPGGALSQADTRRGGLLSTQTGESQRARRRAGRWVPSLKRPK